MANRIPSVERMTSERRILDGYIKRGENFPADVARSDAAEIDNPIEQEEVGYYRPDTSRRLATADLDMIEAFRQAELSIPTFLEAGPRERLRIRETPVRAAIVTCGGLAPGLHSVIHSIVQRHIEVYGRVIPSKVYGVYDSFKGLCDSASNLVDLEPSVTRSWLASGGSNLGCMRFYLATEQPAGRVGAQESLGRVARRAVRKLERKAIQILYVLGGDGSMRVAHEIAKRLPECCVVGLPKTLDNDILWVEPSFGFDTAVQKATEIIDTLCCEAASTRRIGIVELFGAESGYVAANAALASGRADLVLIPEVFASLSDSKLGEAKCNDYWNRCLDHVGRRVSNRDPTPYALIVVAEGVQTVLADRHLRIRGRKVERTSVVELLKAHLARSVRDARGKPLHMFTNQPRHYIRAVPANPNDQNYATRLGAMAVDSALAGYRDCVVSKWLTEYVLVPLPLVCEGQKTIPITGIFWNQVVNSTGQPSHHAP